MGYMMPARLEKCGFCGCSRHLHTEPTWPLANGACLMCEKGCKAFQAAARQSPGDASPSDPSPSASEAQRRPA